MMGLYLRYKFQIGPSIYCIVKATAAVAGVYDSYVIEDITGGGDMYENTNSFTSEHYNPDTQRWESDNAKWGEFIGTTLNFYMQPKVAQGTIDLSGATKISNYFLSGLVFDNVILGSPTWIGAHAFDGGFATVNVSELSYHTCNRMTSVVIPSSVTYIGDEAFAYCNLLDSITFANNNYSIEDYGGSGIFFVREYAGRYVDNHGKFITDVSGNEDILAYDWETNFNRVLTSSPSGGKVICVYSESAHRILEFHPMANEPSNPSDYAVRVAGAGYLKLVETSSRDASPVRIYTGSKIMALEKR